MDHLTFPTFNHIDDVIPHIEGWDEFKVMDKGWYTVINYVVAFEETFSYDSHDGSDSYLNTNIRRECRGLIFDNETGNLISRPYHKFFNAGERDETQLNKILCDMAKDKGFHFQKKKECGVPIAKILAQVYDILL